MVFVVSDLHGNESTYKKMLETIRFSGNDSLYVLGDIIDRGKDGVKILQDMMARRNVYPILGNHELMALPILNELSVGEYDYVEEETMIQEYTYLSRAGDAVTLREFCRLPKCEKKKLADYVSSFPLYREICVNQQQYLLVHAGLPDFSPGLDISYYTAEELTFGPHDYTQRCFEDTILITGHMPTFLIEENTRNKIYRNENNIAIDCGMGFGGVLGVLCLDTAKEYYC